MDATSHAGHRGDPTFSDLFTPKLITVLREGYGLDGLRADALAGLTVAIVALPLSMAIAIGAGLSPERGLYAAIVGGFLISLLGGSRFQIGGPAAAFIGLVALTVQRHGYDGLMLATLMAGALLIVIGFLRLGTYIKYIPYPVTVGFTAGIAVIILISQARDLLGLTLVNDPADTVPKLKALWAAVATVNPVTVALSVFSIGAILVVRRLRPNWPALLIAVAGATVLTFFLGLNVETIGSRFGAIPSGMPTPAIPPFSLEKIRAVAPDALAIALLGAIESLLSAVVADSMSGRRHRSNSELVAQGIANMSAALTGGTPVTGTIARTATNIRAGARGPVAGMLHAVYLLIFVMVAMPLVAYVPLASLAGVLVVVAWAMADKAEFALLLRTSLADAVILVATFLLTVFVDLLTGISVGVLLGSFLFMHRMAEAIDVQGGAKLVRGDVADAENNRPSYRDHAMPRDVMVYRISGAFFFGATARVNLILDRVVNPPRVFILDFTDVPFVDITASAALERFVQRLHKAGTKVYFAGVRPQLRRSFGLPGLRGRSVHYVSSVETALERVEKSGGA
ncbi:SulP family inorganic anion transporter [Pseudorhodoplanes sp.]|uniref:SulP family inorganic anion transporter n=1 Tax=Pseudorhodoplanes sp. TaxID=1934341 RepID=UPI002C73BFD2|nr:SulP family inorganic anion transporter [Pseudorhodoplanes sp.]HWV52851.1 SulP family inorganic anion transporter [Pseudorhodoplanes sp.]